MPLLAVRRQWLQRIRSSLAGVSSDALLVDTAGSFVEDEFIRSFS